MATFEELQRNLATLWPAIGGPGTGAAPEHTVVVVPSASLGVPIPPTLQRMVEERMLWTLFMLREPRRRMVYATSQPVEVPTSFPSTWDRARR